MIRKCYTRGTEEQYKEMKRTEKRILREKKRRFYEEQIKQAENYHTQKESGRFYQLVKDIG
jgi:hypothetical protein